MQCSEGAQSRDLRTLSGEGIARLLVNAVTSWALIDRSTGRIMRVPRDVAAQFLPDDA